jgi:hypothetical protein
MVLDAAAREGDRVRRRRRRGERTSGKQHRAAEEPDEDADRGDGASHPPLYQSGSGRQGLIDNLPN